MTNDFGRVWILDRWQEYGLLALEHYVMRVHDLWPNLSLFKEFYMYRIGSFFVRRNKYQLYLGLSYLEGLMIV